MPVRQLDTKTLAGVNKLQDYGDQMREGVGGSPDFAAVARELIAEIQRTRAARLGREFTSGREVIPDGKPRAYIVDSLRHPAEVELFRSVYGNAFILVGVVCEESKRLTRMAAKYDDGGQAKAREFMKRDNDDGAKKHGQHVSDAFHLADFFVDNADERELSASVANPEWRAAEDLGRLVKIVTGPALERPNMAETAMYHAFSTQMQSACISRQVGAALVDKRGNIVSTGANEVPKAGGGVYGESESSDPDEGRCALFPNQVDRFCRNTQCGRRTHSRHHSGKRR